MPDPPVAVVTGASRGIGRALAERFSAEGYAVACLARGAQGVGETAGRIRAAGGHALPLVADVRDAEAVAAAVGRVVDEFGRIDVLVNNAGTFVKATVQQLSLQDWRDQLETSLSGAFHMVRAVLDQMLRQPPRRGIRGHVVGINSGAAVAGYPTGAAYSAAKAGMLGFADSLRAEVAGAGVKVTEVVVAATVDTAMSASRAVDKLSAADVAETVVAAVLAPPPVVVTRLDLGQVVVAGDRSADG